MATNEILLFCPNDTGTNLLTQSAYAEATDRTNGNQPGIARSKLVNKALRQVSVIAGGVAQFMADNQANNITDSLTEADISSYMAAAIGNIATPTGFMDLTTNQIVTSGTKTFNVSPLVPTAGGGDSSSKAANTNWVQGEIATLDATLVHKTGNETIAGVKTFSSSPLAPTPTAGDSSTKLATTAFVATALSTIATYSCADGATPGQDYVLSLLGGGTLPPAYVDGMMCVFTPSSASIGGVTATMKLGALPAKSFVMVNSAGAGVNLGKNSISVQPVIAVYSLAFDLFVLTNPQPLVLADQNITNTKTYTFPHGLGAIPSAVYAEMECTAVDNGWQIGDVIGNQGAVGAVGGMTVSYDATNVYMVYSSIYTNNKTTGGLATITTATPHWKLRFKCEN